MTQGTVAGALPTVPGAQSGSRSVLVVVTVVLRVPVVVVHLVDVIAVLHGFVPALLSVHVVVLRVLPVLLLLLLHLSNASSVLRGLHRRFTWQVTSLV